MRKVYRDPDIDDTKLRDRIVGIIGYGNQGRVQAWNLRDGGFRLLIGLRESSPSWESARQDGFEVRTLQEVAKGTQFLVFAIPDLVHGMTYQKLEEDLRPGTTLCFLHGFSIHYGLVRVRPDVNAVLVAPKGVATEFRKRFLAGSGVPAIVGVAQDFTGDALGMTLAYGKAIGCSRAGLYLSSFAEETEADLFTEQALLCGGVPFLLSEVFVSLVKAGYSEEIAYFETVQELKFIVDLICEKGLAGMFASISPTAHFGALEASKRFQDSGITEVVQGLFAGIRNGDFVQRLLSEQENLNQVLGNHIQQIGQSPLHKIFMQMHQGN